METLRKSLILALVPLLFVVGCKDNDSDNPTPSLDPFEVMTAYMVQNNMDLTNILDGWITSAPATVNDVPAFVANNYIIDIRSATDYGNGHIEGAVNTSLGNILTEAANANGKPIVVVCYTGQSAAHAVVALRLSGYSDAKTLKFGMSSWHSTLDKWTTNTGDVAIGDPNWVTTPTTHSTTFGTPTITSSSTDGATILAERVDAMLNGGFQGIANADVLTAPSNYFINNFWDQADVTEYGIIDGAYRIKPLTLANDEFLYLNPSQTIVTYCWTGQTSSMITAYLSVLGYDARSLKFGCNGMIYSDLNSHKFSAPSVDLPVVTE